jgi:hypothetical protein
MSKGCIILANDTNEFRYTKLAKLAAARVSKHLRIPVEIVSDEVERDNHRVLKDSNNKLVWKNLNRTKIYDITPWQRTLVIDADYIVNSDTLTAHLAADFDFAMVRSMYNPMTGEPFKPMMGYSTIQQMWATVMIFNKSDIAAKIFAMADHVLEHYEYYAKVYCCPPRPLRNDYAFTIACHLMGGYGNGDFALRDFRMANCDFNTKVLEINEHDVLIAQNREQGKTHIQRLKGMDVHLQNKVSLFGLIDETMDS